MPARSRVIVVPGQVIGQKVVEFFPGRSKDLMGRLIQGFQLEPWLHRRNHGRGREVRRPLSEPACTRPIFHWY